MKFFASILFFLSLGCRFSSDLAGLADQSPKDAIGSAQASGSWNFALIRRAPDCQDGGLPTGTTVAGQLGFGQNGQVIAGTSDWRLPPSTIRRTLDGSVRYADGAVDLVLFGDTPSVGMQLVGLMLASGTFSGMLLDPAQNLTPFSTPSGCIYDVTGTKNTSPGQL